jgi:hypothetical protein
VLVFERESDARRVHDVLGKRFEKYGLTLHPEKTQLLSFFPPTGGKEEETFVLLGFTHFWARSRKGNSIVKRKTNTLRLSAALQRVGKWCRLHRHDPIPDQHQYLSSVIRGHCQYYGITGNSWSLQLFREGVRYLWRKWLKRRSNATARNGRAWWDGLCKNYPMPPAIAVHSVLRVT